MSWKDVESVNWKPIEGWPGFEVSDRGHVKNKTGKVLKRRFNKGWPTVSVYIKPNNKKFFVHKLVAQHFIENNDPAKKVVRHLNGMKWDNRVSNLEWAIHPAILEGKWDGLTKKEKQMKNHDELMSVLGILIRQKEKLENMGYKKAPKKLEGIINDFNEYLEL